MTIMQIFGIGVAVLFFLCMVIAIGMVFYLGRNKVKAIDRLVYGFEIPSDSIFFQNQRIPHYGAAFAWYFYARRCHLLNIRDHFDKKFQRAFVITYYLYLTGALLIVFMAVDQLFLHIT